MRRRLLVTCSLALAAMLAVAAPAGAHQPVFLGSTDDGDRPVDEAPLLVDGTVSFAVYGTLDESGATASVQAVYAEGDTASAELLIPALAPETEVADDLLPRLVVTRPDGTEVEVAPELREPFDEPFSRTSYLRLVRWSEPAQAGTYTVGVTASTPLRYTLAIGLREVPGEVERYEPQPIAELAEWYETPAAGTVTADGAPGAPSTTAPAEPGAGDADGTTDPTSEAAESDDDDGAGGVMIIIVLLVVALGFGLSAVSQRLRRDRPPTGPGS